MQLSRRAGAFFFAKFITQLIRSPTPKNSTFAWTSKAYYIINSIISIPHPSSLIIIISPQLFAIHFLFLSLHIPGYHQPLLLHCHPLYNVLRHIRTPTLSLDWYPPPSHQPPSLCRCWFFSRDSRPRRYFFFSFLFYDHGLLFDISFFTCRAFASHRTHARIHPPQPAVWFRSISHLENSFFCLFRPSCVRFSVDTNRHMLSSMLA